MSTAEDDRAREYQAQQRRRERAERQRQRALLPADRAPARAIAKGWQPIADWLRERAATERS